MVASRIVMVLACLLVSWSCAATEPGAQAEAAGAVLNACIESATTGAPVDTGPLTTYFKPNRAGTSLTANAGLPKIKLEISNKGTFRCVLTGKGGVKDSEFATALVAKLKEWPRMQAKTLSDGTESYGLLPDAERNLLATAITIELVYGNVWTVMVWGTESPAAPKAD